MKKTVLAVLVVLVGCVSQVRYDGPSHAQRPFMYETTAHTSSMYNGFSTNPPVVTTVHVVNPFFDRTIWTSLDCEDSMWNFAHIPPRTEQLILVERGLFSTGRACRIMEWGFVWPR